MYAEIKSTALDSKSGGKTQWALVFDLSAALKLHSPFSGSIGKQPWAITIGGTSVHEYGTGARGGARKEVRADLRIELSPSDVAGIMNFAIANGLLQVSPATVPVTEQRSA